jgi:hypothetical protein
VHGSTEGAQGHGREETPRIFLLKKKRRGEREREKSVHGISGRRKKKGRGNKKGRKR